MKTSSMHDNFFEVYDGTALICKQNDRSLLKLFFFPILNDQVVIN